jgi:methyl-accepting chemotaxis protein
LEENRIVMKLPWKRRKEKVSAEPETELAKAPELEKEPEPGNFQPSTQGGIRFGIRAKVLSSFLVIFLLTIGLGIVVEGQAQRVKSGVDQVYSRDFVGMGKIAVIARDVGTDYAATLGVLQAADAHSRAVLRQEIGGYDSSISASLRSIAANPDPGVRSLVGQFRTMFADYATARNQAISVGLASPGLPAASLAEATMQDRYVSVIGALDQLTHNGLGNARATDTRILAGLRGDRNTILLMSLIGAILALGLALFFSTRISRRLRSVTKAAAKLAEGDFSQRADARSRDEVGVLADAFNSMADQIQAMVEAEREANRVMQEWIADQEVFVQRVGSGDLTVRLQPTGDKQIDAVGSRLNTMVGSLGDMSGRVREAASSMGAATSEILAAVSQHTASTAEQSSAISQTAVTVEEVRASAEQASRRAQDVAKQAETSAQVSDDGSRTVEHLVAGMTEIRDRVQEMARNILALSQQTQLVGDITATVNDLADQSNMLALNAAIEAAKAGEQGKGFAVVAAEVRTLAEQSKQATAQVQSILGEIQRGTNQAVQATEEGTRVVETGVDLAQRSGDVINQLAGTIRETALAAQAIAASAHEQSIGMDQIAQAMTDINQMTTQFVAGAQQSQAAAEGLRDLADRLQTLTERYRVSEEALEADASPEAGPGEAA